MKKTLILSNSLLLLSLLFLSCGKKNYSFPRSRNQAIKILDRRLNQLLLAGLDQCGPVPTKEDRIIDVISTRYTLLDRYENVLLDDADANDRENIKQELINNLKNLPNGILKRVMVDERTKYIVSYTFQEKSGNDIKRTSWTCTLVWRTEDEEFGFLQ